MTEVLHEDGLSGSYPMNTVRLSGEYGSWYDSVQEVLMKQSEDTVKLYAVEEGKKTKVFTLTSAEIDALIEARAAFKQSILDAKAAEEKRVAAEVEQVRELVSTVARDHRKSWELQEANERFSLHDVSNSTTLIYPVLASSVLKTVKAYFVQRNLIEPDPEEKPAGDDFDPFLDSADLP